MRYVLSLILLLPFSLSAQQKFARKAVLDDLAFLRESLEQVHYNLYAYTSKEEFTANYEAVRAAIAGDSLSQLEATNAFQRVVSKANNGHTEVPFPIAAYIAYAQEGGTLFPLELTFENGKALVSKNWSSVEALLPGTEILSINNTFMHQVLEGIYPLVSAERDYFKLAKIELLSFPRLYWQAYGFKEVFEVTVQGKDKIETYRLPAVAVINGYEMQRDEIFHLDREMKLLDSAAYLRPGNFGGDQVAYCRFIDSCFVAIQEAGSAKLVIDLRNNLGGDDFFSDYLVAYLADKPFRWCASFSLKTSDLLKRHVRTTYDTTQAYWQEVLRHPSGTTYPYSFPDYQPMPASKRYTGKVQVLINRQTHSQAAVAAAQLQDYGWATLVGEETGDCPTLFASQFGFVLPNTGLEVKIAKGYIVRVNGSEKLEGVLPNIQLPDALLDEQLGIGK